MSTRGIYKIEGAQIYIHHDNYPSGAAVRFAETLRRNSGSITAFEFARANERAELMPGKIPGDVEYIYEVKNGHIYCYRWENIDEFGYDKIFHSSGEIHEWINRYIYDCLEESDNIKDYTFIKKENQYGDKISRFFSISYLEKEVKRHFDYAVNALEKGWIGNSSGSFKSAADIASLFNEESSKIMEMREKYLNTYVPILVEKYGHKDSSLFRGYWGA